MTTLERRFAEVPGHWQVPGHFKINHSHGIRVGDMIYVGGQEDLDADGNVNNPGDIVAQCKNVMESLKRVIESLGGTMGDVVQFNTFYAGELSYEEWQRTYDIRFSYFPAPRTHGDRHPDRRGAEPAGHPGGGQRRRHRRQCRHPRRSVRRRQPGNARRSRGGGRQ
ncbi:RidA family protein [Paenarthrobacter nicotinovorans]|uniref:RidA family protein n=1 Tax=Paenarthrobacter nicotinovorans TaxID=29320 RepID=UPI0011A3C2DC|nr:RidA family protein [Paenarthrobacter nicotinovorans]